jgi:crotonobetainyl-CoA:carnitine CoA-transferase CaiB-like acyl-CoA transferase
VSAYFLCANRNKKSVTADITRPEGQALLRQLAEKSDIVIENYKRGGLKQYGLDYDSLRAINPRLIYCSITGFGHTGPYADRAGYDFLIQAMGGLMSITGAKDGEPGAGPQKVGVALTDILTGLYSTVGILAALAHRHATGEGQCLDMALLDVQVACLANQASNYLVGGKAPVRMGNAHPNIVPYQDFPTSDGHMVIATGNDGQFTRLCEAAGHPELARDPRYADNKARVANRVALIEAMNAFTVGRSTADWIALLEEAGVPCGPINDVEQVFADPHVQARGLRFHRIGRCGPSGHDGGHRPVCQGAAGNGWEEPACRAGRRGLDYCRRLRGTRVLLFDRTAMHSVQPPDRRAHRAARLRGSAGGETARPACRRRAQTRH